jgi:hypothetical protein
MLLDEYIIINITNKNKKYFKNKGYDITQNGKYSIKIIDLPKGSHVRIRVKCDICNQEKEINYYDYYNITKDNTQLYYCYNCKNIKTKKTCIERYEVENVFQLEDVKNKIKETNNLLYNKDFAIQNDLIQNKSIQTNLKKHGVKFPTQNIKTINKQKQTNIERYGCEFTLNNENVKNKSNITKIIKFGTTNLSKSKIIQERKLITRLKNLNINYPKYNFVNYKDDFYYIKCDNCCEHTFKILPELFRNRVKQHTIVCTVCNPVNSFSISGIELEFQKFIKQIYNKEIVLNERKLIKPFEIDVYLKDLNIAFEFNGVFWHNEFNKTKDYHKNKTDLLLVKNIQLLHIWEDDWLYKNDIIKSIIKNKLGIIENKIFAIECKIKIIKDSEMIKTFLDSNHIQGYTQSSIKIGLFYKNKLVSIMIFSKTNNDNYEINRFCDKINNIVVGSALKMFKFFMNKYKPKEVLTYLDRDLSTGQEYELLGFERIEETSPTYSYVINGIRKNKNNKAHKEFYYGVFNSGNYIFRYKNILVD